MKKKNSISVINFTIKNLQTKIKIYIIGVI